MFWFNETFEVKLQKNNSEFNNKNNCKIIIYYIIRPNTFILVITQIDYGLQVKGLASIEANPKKLKY